VGSDNPKPIEDCATAIAIRDAPPIIKTRARFRKADIAIGEGSVQANEGDA